MATTITALKAQGAARRARRKLMERVGLIALQILLTLTLITFSADALDGLILAQGAHRGVCSPDRVDSGRAPMAQLCRREAMCLLADLRSTRLSSAGSGDRHNHFLVHGGLCFARLRWPGRDLMFGLLMGP